MQPNSKWSVPNEKQEQYIDSMTKILPSLRALAGVTQDELARAIGVSRQTYSAAESGKRRMTWGTYLSLVLFFDYNFATRDAFRDSGAFPKELIDKFNTDSLLSGHEVESVFGNDATKILMMLKALDSQGLFSLKTVLWVEYARCTKQPGEAILKSFNGETLAMEPSAKYRAAQKALRNIQEANHG